MDNQNAKQSIGSEDSAIVADADGTADNNEAQDNNGAKVGPAIKGANATQDNNDGEPAPKSSPFPQK